MYTVYCEFCGEPYLVTPDTTDGQFGPVEFGSSGECDNLACPGESICPNCGDTDYLYNTDTGAPPECTSCGYTCEV